MGLFIFNDTKLYQSNDRSRHYYAEK